MPLVGDRVRLAPRPHRSFRRPLRRRLFHASAHAPAAILLLKRLTGVPCAVHGFELQPNMAAALEKEAATLLAEPERAGSSFFVHVLGVGAAPASLRAHDREAPPGP